MERQLYAFGSNGSAQLGLGHEEDLDVPEYCNSGDQVAKRDIKTLKAGGNHTLVLAQDGSAFAAGAIHDGRAGKTRMLSRGLLAVQGLVGLGWHSISVSNAKEHKQTDRFAFATTTWEASIFVPQSRDAVYTCGTGSKGELGQGDGISYLEDAQPIACFPPEGVRIVDVASCMRHTVVVLDNGEAWGWGAGRHGQLGEPAATVWDPRKLDGVPFKVVRAACGKDFIILAASPENGNVLVLGSDKYSVVSSAPNTIIGWKQVEATWSDVYVLFHDGRLIAWGRTDFDKMLKPDVPPLEQIAAGSEHVVALGTDGKLLTWGWGEHGNCGKGAVGGKVNEVKISHRVELVGAGCATSFIVA